MDAVNLRIGDFQGGFMSVEKHLNKLEITVKQANDFISANINDPEKLFFAAFDNAVTTDMLREITNYSTDTIRGYFADAGFDSKDLDQTHTLVNFDPGSLENLIDYDKNTEGILSVNSLRAKVEPLTRHSDYDSYYNEIFFEKTYPFQVKDGVYDPEESGIKHLGNIPAIDENLESVFYGSLINIFLRIDEHELTQIENFSGNKNSVEYRTLLLNSITSLPTNPIDNNTLEKNVIDDAARIIVEHQAGGIVGLLDASFLGLAFI